MLQIISESDEFPLSKECTLCMALDKINKQLEMNNQIDSEMDENKVIQIRLMLDMNNKYIVAI